MHWQECVLRSEAYKALNQSEVWLDRESGDYPWEFVTDVKPGGSHRLEIDTTVWFYAQHPCGLTFRWSFDVEPWSANGSGYYQINVEGIKQVLSKLKTSTANRLLVYLADCAEKVGKKAEEWERIAQLQRKTETDLRSLL